MSSQIWHPKRGRNGRSPNAVDKMIVIAFLISSSPETSVIEPVWSMRNGKGKPCPTNSFGIEIDFLSL